MLTKEQKIWKGENYSAKNGISWLFRQLVTELDPNNPRSKPSYYEVKIVVHLSCIKWFFFWSFLLVSVSLETFLAHNSTTFFNCFRLLGLASTSTDPSDNPQKKSSVNLGLGSLQARKFPSNWRQHGSGTFPGKIPNNRSVRFCFFELLFSPRCNLAWI